MIPLQDRPSNWKQRVVFGVLGLVFLGVIGVYQVGLHGIEHSYERLLDTTVAQEKVALEISQAVLQARRAEKDFLLRMDTAYAEKVAKQVDLVGTLALTLAGIAKEIHDAEGMSTAEDIQKYIKSYGESFASLAVGWQRVGLTPDEGLNGIFRSAAHKLEDQLKAFDVDMLRTLLLEARRAEKDFRLRRDVQYMTHHHELMQAMLRETEASLLNETAKTQILALLKPYQDAVAQAAEEIAANGNDATPETAEQLSTTAHHLEQFLDARHVRGGWRDYLLARRAEKDYQARGNEKYVQQLQEQVAHLAKAIQASGVSEENKQPLQRLLTEYQEAFLSTVAESNHIKELTEQMRSAVHAIDGPVEQALQHAREAQTQGVSSIQKQAIAVRRQALGLAALGLLLGVIAIWRRMPMFDSY